jgi:hypothetical protein
VRAIVASAVCSAAGGRGPAKRPSPVEPRVDPLEERRGRNGRLARDGVAQPVDAPGRGARQRQQLRHPLALVHAARLGADLAVRAAEQRVERRAGTSTWSGVAGFCCARGPKPDASVQNTRVACQGRSPCLDLIGETGRIRRRAERLDRQLRRGLVMLPAPFPAADEADDDVRTDRTNVADEIAQDLVVAPPVERFLDAERVAEVDRAREVLLGAVDPVRRVQFLGAQHAERLEDLRADLVLAAVAARRRHEHRPHPLPEAQFSQQRVVLVVRMRGGLHVGADGVELAQHQAQRDLAGMLADGLDAQLRRQRGAAGEGQGQGEKKMQRAAHERLKDEG